MNYTELTGQESGIFIYKEPDQAIICNWSSVESDNRRPMVFGEYLLWPPMDKEVHWEWAGSDVDIDEWMKSFDIIYDENNDAENGFHEKAEVYDCGDYMILAPKGWN